MFPQITQKNLSVILPLKIARISGMIAEEKQISPLNALILFYQSEVYALLEQEETKLWYESAAQIYENYLKGKLTDKSYHHGPGHSQLSAYFDQISIWKRQGKTYREMANDLKEIGCITTPQNIWRFLRRHGSCIEGETP